MAFASGPQGEETGLQLLLRAPRLSQISPEAEQGVSAGGQSLPRSFFLLSRGGMAIPSAQPDVASFGKTFLWEKKRF